jgi:hypothetical protein
MSDPSPPLKWRIEPRRIDSLKSHLRNSTAFGDLPPAELAAIKDDIEHRGL